jgi:hypothetical protein
VRWRPWLRFETERQENVRKMAEFDTSNQTMTMQSMKVKKSHPRVSKTLGSFFKSKRLEAGIAIEAVAEYLEVSPLEFEAYESGVKSIPLNRVYALSNFLNISPEEITRMVNFGD